MTTTTTKKEQVMPAQKFTANQAAVMEAIANGAGTDAEIGESLTSMKLSAIGTVVRSLVKREAVQHDAKGRYQLNAERADEVTPALEEKAASHEETGDARAAGLQDAVDIAVQRQKDGAAFETTKSGQGAKVVTVGKGCYVTTDGKHLTAIDRVESTKEEPWVLYRVSSKGSLRFVSTHKSSTAALPSSLGDH